MNVRNQLRTIAASVEIDAAALTAKAQRKSESAATMRLWAETKSEEECRVLLRIIEELPAS